MSIINRKIAMTEKWCLEGIVQEEEDHYLIDLTPCLPGPILKIPKNYVEVTSTDKEITCFDHMKQKLSLICIKKNTTGLLIQPINIDEYISNSMSFSENGDEYLSNESWWRPRVPNFPNLPRFRLSCDHVCSATLPGIYPQVKEGLRKARDAGIIRDKAHCKEIAGDVAKLTKILTDVGVPVPGAGYIARYVANECGKCACDKVF